MFTGLIEEVGAVSRRSGADLAILAKTVLEDVREGDSIAINGVCLTVVVFDEHGFVVQLSPETLERTTLGTLKPGDAVNLERAMALGGRMGGHFVQGHVDGIGFVKAVRPQGDFAFWEFNAPAAVAKYIVPKGSIAVDGISLTVVDPIGDSFGVAVIPETIKKTALAMKRPGDKVNLEADMIGKHIHHFIKNMTSGGVTLDSLKRHGFA